MGRIPLSSSQLRQSLLWPGFHRGNSASLEGVPDTMNARFVDRLSLCSAIGIGLGLSTEYPVGIIGATGMPLACLIPGTRKAAFKSSLAYCLAGLWPMVPGLDRYLGQSVSPLIPVTLWVLTSALLSAPWAIVWTSDRHRTLLMAIAARASLNGSSSARDHWLYFAAHRGGLPFSGNRLVRPHGDRAAARDSSFDAFFRSTTAQRRIACCHHRWCWARHRWTGGVSRQCGVDSRMDGGEHLFWRRVAAFPGFCRGSVHPKQGGNLGASPDFPGSPCAPLVGCNRGFLARVA
jgi:hypothetical protein